MRETNALSCFLLTLTIAFATADIGTAGGTATRLGDSVVVGDAEDTFSESFVSRATTLSPPDAARTSRRSGQRGSRRASVTAVTPKLQARRQVCQPMFRAGAACAAFVDYLATCFVQMFCPIVDSIVCPIVFFSNCLSKCLSKCCQLCLFNCVCSIVCSIDPSFLPIMFPMWSPTMVAIDATREAAVW